MIAARLSTPATPGSQLVVQTLERLGGTATRAEVLARVSRLRGRRDGGCAIALAVLAGDVVNVVMPDGRHGLHLREREGQR